MKKTLLSFLAVSAFIGGAQAQWIFDPEISVNPNTDFEPTQVRVPASPLTSQILFVGGVDVVQTTSHYGNPADTAIAKEWHDFIGFTADTTGASMGWVSVNHERITSDDELGDGGGMTVFQVKRATNGDLEIMDQTLTDGRSGKFFNVDFVNTVGSTGMNCGGIVSTVDGRIWTAEEWFRSSNTSINDRDTSDFTIGTGTADGLAAPNGFPNFDGQSMQKYENYNWMVEIDPREAVAIRKQYNWGRAGWEGGAVLPDNKTVILGMDATPGFMIKFVADTPGDFTVGDLFVQSHVTPGGWIQIDNDDLNATLDIYQQCIDAGATMYNRLEWVAYDPSSGDVFLTETGRDNPASRWIGESMDGALHAPHHINRANVQGTHPDSSDYTDYYGRVIRLDMTTNSVSSFLEGGPTFADSVLAANYPDVHLSNPDGLSFMQSNGHTFMVIQEDLNGISNGRVPAGITNRTCEIYLLDMRVPQPTLNDLTRIAVVPLGAEVTGAIGTPDGKTLLFNSQHPSSSNPFPYNHSLTMAIHGFDQITDDITSVPEVDGDDAFSIYPNPVSRTLYLSEQADVAIYDATGKRIRVHRAVTTINISGLAKGIYYLQNNKGETKKMIVE